MKADPTLRAVHVQGSESERPQNDALPAVPEEAPFVKSLRRSRSPFYGRLAVGARVFRRVRASTGPRKRAQVGCGRGGQGRPVRAARRGSLDGPGGSVVASHNGVVRTAPLGGPWLPLWVGHSGPHQCSCLSWATEVLGDRPFLRVGSHGVLRPQPDGLTQIVGLATRVGATAGTGLASWLCPSLLKRPPGGPRRGSRRP
jgi:hypothetical protein